MIHAARINRVARALCVTRSYDDEAAGALRNMAIEPNDWRLRGQERYLRGLRWSWKAFEPTPRWDHEHCAFCFAKLMKLDAPDILREGYATADDKHWVCAPCFADFRESFGWTVA